MIGDDGRGFRDFARDHGGKLAGPAEIMLAMALAHADEEAEYGAAWDVMDTGLDYPPGSIEYGVAAAVAREIVDCYGLRVTGKPGRYGPDRYLAREPAPGDDDPRGGA